MSAYVDARLKEVKGFPPHVCADWPHADRCTGHGKEPPSPLLWSPHLCASELLQTQQTYLFSCLSRESKKCPLSWLKFLLSTTDKHFNYLLFLTDLLIFSFISNTLSPFQPLLLSHKNSPRLYQTSISPLRVRTSMMVWPRKSSLSRLNLCFTRDLMSSSSSHTRTLMRSDELWHSLDEEGGQTGGKHKKLTTVIQKGWGKLVQINYNYCVGLRHKNKP